jgi:hypothetical protein
MPAPESTSRNPRNLPDVYRPLWQQSGSWVRRRLIQGLGSLEVQLQGWLTQLEAQQAAESNRVTLRSLAVTAIARGWLGLLRQWRLWNTALVQLKRRLPWLRSIPNGGLTFGVILLFAGLIWGVVVFWPSSVPPSADVPVSPSPAKRPVPQAPSPAPSNSLAPETRPTDPVGVPDTPPPPPAGQAADQSGDKDTVSPTLTEPRLPTQSRPPAAQTEGSSAPTTALPTLEQRLLSQLQAQLQGQEDSPTAILLDTVQAHGQQLQVGLKPAWKTLTPDDQDAAAARLQTLSRELGFERLDLVDRQSRVLARSPVVGEKMVILQRRGSTPLAHPTGP